MNAGSARVRAVAAALGRAARPLAAAALCALLAAALPARVAQASDAAFDRLAARFLDEWLERRPHVATRLGLHRWDGRLRVVTPQSVASDLAWLRGI